jgi:uracil-DNA glycosylase
MNWKTIIEIEQEQDYFKNIQKILDKEYKRYVVYPPRKLLLNPFKFTPFDKVKVVILAQEPWNKKDQAMGLSFSVPDGVDIPQASKNIFREVADNMGYNPDMSGSMEGWAKQGVLMLNSVLTVRKDEPRSHSNIGWTEFTDNIIKHVAHHNKHVVFMLWGSHIWKKKSLANFSRYGKYNKVLTAGSPMASSIVNIPFFGCKHFSKANEYLINHGMEPINWLKNK